MTWSPTEPYNELPLLPPSLQEIETRQVLKSVTEARVQLAKLDQASDLMANPSVLINTIPLLEAQASSEIENIVTTTDALFKAAQIDDGTTDPAIKETLRYRSALRSGFENMKDRALTARTAIDVCTAIKGIDMDVRKVPGTRIANQSTGEIIYAPPEGSDTITEKLTNWERFVHADDGLDPIVKMAVAHYQFEAIHPFADGNGRTGRILNILMLNNAGLLRLPILYISRYIIEHKDDYYSLLREVTSAGNWERWILFMLEAVRQSSDATTKKILAIRDLQAEFRARYAGTSQGMSNVDFLTVLFDQPYCRIQNVVDHCGVSRPTATKYLDALTGTGALTKVKVGRDVLFLNHSFLAVLADRNDPAAS